MTADTSFPSSARAFLGGTHGGGIRDNFDKRWVIND
jgi:hypothetical protein